MAQHVSLVSWRDRVLYSLTRENESDALARKKDADSDDTYNTYDDVAAVHLESTQQVLREIPVNELEQIGSASIQVVTDVGSGFVPLPVGTVRILNGTIQETLANASFFPAIGPLHFDAWIQCKQIPASEMLQFACVNGRVEYTGYAIKLLILVEPTLALCEQDIPILPSGGYLEAVADLAHGHITFADWLPVGRV